MKKLLWVLLPLILLTATALSVSAQYVYDYADILTVSEEAYLENLAETESRKHGISIVVLTEYGIGGADPMVYAADFYDYGGFANDGVILFLEMGERDWRLVNTGRMMDVIGDYELSYIEDRAIPYFSAGDYAEGFEQYIIIASALTDRYVNGTYPGDGDLPDYDPESPYDESESVGGMYYLVAFGISLLIAFLVCLGFKSQLNNAVKKTGATDYFRQENARVTHSADRFLYSRTTKRAKPSDNNSGSRSGRSSTFSGSSGRSHSGGGGKF